MYHYKDCGLDYIYLLNGYEIINDPEFGECISIHDLEGLHRQIAKNIVSKAPSIRGQEVRFFFIVPNSSLLKHKWQHFLEHI